MCPGPSDHCYRQCQGVPTCFFTAIVTDREVLRTSNDHAAKLASLKFLVTGLGTFINRFTCPSRMIAAGASSVRAAPARTVSTGSGYLHHREEARNGPADGRARPSRRSPESDKAAWVAVPLEGWANESFQVTRRKSRGCVRVGTKCVYQQGDETFTVGEGEKSRRGQRRSMCPSFVTGWSGRDPIRLRICCTRR